MKKSITVALMAVLLIVPVGLIVGFSYSGSSHPIENRFLHSTEFLDKSAHQVEVVFFGYPGCATICPVSLAKLSSVLESPKIIQSGDEIGATFINVHNKLDVNTLSVDSYSSSFSPNIRGYNPDVTTYRDLSEEFALRIYSNRTQGSQISHTDHFFILQKHETKWRVYRVLDNSADKELLEKVISDALADLN